MIWPAIRAASALPPGPACSSSTQTAETGCAVLVQCEADEPAVVGPIRGGLRGAGLAADRVAVDRGRPPGAVLDHADHHVAQVTGDLRVDRLAKLPRAWRCSSWWSGPGRALPDQVRPHLAAAVGDRTGDHGAFERGHPDVVLADGGLGQSGRVGAAVRVLHVPGPAGRRAQAALAELADGQVLLLEAELAGLLLESLGAEPHAELGEAGVARIGDRLHQGDLRLRADRRRRRS